MTLSGIAALALAGGLPLYGLGDVPSAKEIKHNIAFYEQRCEQTCQYKPELVKVRNVACTPLSEKFIRKWDEWDAEGGARCTYSYAVPDLQGRYLRHRVTETFVLRRWACGAEGQEADMWCLTWNGHKE